MTECRMVDQTLKHAPRGNASAGGISKASKNVTVNADEHTDEHVDIDTLQHVLLHNKHTFESGKEAISTYVERNSCTEIHKAIAIQVFSTAISTWKSKITEAAQLEQMLVVHQ